MNSTASAFRSLRQRRRPATRLTLALLLLGWLLLQVLLLMLSGLPGMTEAIRAITLAIAAAAPLTACLLVIHFPDADVSPESLKFLLLVAALGFAAATAARWVFRPVPARGS